MSSIHGRKFLVGTVGILSATVSGGVLDLGDTLSIGTIAQAATSPYDWMQFNGDARHSGVNTVESQLTAQNVGNLTQLFQVTLPAAADSSPVVLTRVNTGSATRDLLFVNTKAGHILALDAHTGVTVWSHQITGTDPTASTPAIDPSRNYIYVYALDGTVREYSVVNGAETIGGGWPEIATLKPSVEKGGSALTIATVGATNFLYVRDGGYYGDGGDYQGHVTTVNLGTGAEDVFNTLCSNQTVHFTRTVARRIVPRRSPAFSPLGRRLRLGYREGLRYNGQRRDFNKAAFDWGDTIFAINPNGTGSGGYPLDTYTPTNYQVLQSTDTDLGSAAPAIVPTGSTQYPHIAVQSGKDGVLRIVNLDNLSGQGSVGNTGGELSTASLPQGGEVQNAVIVWKSPTDGSQWVFVVSPDNGIAGLRISFGGGGGLPSLSPVWQISVGGGSPLVANNVLYYAVNGNRGRAQSDHRSTTFLRSDWLNSLGKPGCGQRHCVHHR